MGIDQNIHLVIHWGCPSDMESYYQEFGRAGRDGVVSECYLFYDKQDFKISRLLTKSITNPAYKKFRNDQITQMERYCMLNQCRRKGILGHFGEKKESCTRCDNCIDKKGSTINIIDKLMYPIYIIIHTIFLIKFRLGSSKLCLILKGSKSKSISDLTNISTYSMLKKYTDIQIKSIINILILNNQLKEKTITSGFGSVIETTLQIVNWYSMINSKIDKSKIKFDDIYHILIEPDNQLELNIPIDYIKDLVSISLKKTSDELLEEFNIE
jgi:ATP-dependent DNA helicase RecQ